MLIFKGAIHCGTCRKKVVVIGGTSLHVEKDGTLKVIEGHGPAVGGGR